MHRYRYNHVFASENDVMAFSPLGAATDDLYLRILNGRRRLYIQLCLIATIRLQCTVSDMFLLAGNDVMEFFR